MGNPDNEAQCEGDEVAKWMILNKKKNQTKNVVLFFSDAETGGDLDSTGLLKYI